MDYPGCYLHQNIASAGTCFDCLEPICASCQCTEKVTTYCPPCLKKKRGKRKVRNIAAALVLIPLIGAFAFALWQMEPSFDYGKRYDEVKALKAQVKDEPCSRRANLALNEILNSARDHRGAIENAERFFEECGPYLRLRWTTYHAHKQLSEYAKAVQEATYLTDERPDDQDYWWWRGNAYVGLEDWASAAHDFKQCMLISPRANYCPFDLSNALEKLGKPCEAIFPIEHYLHHYPQHKNENKVVSRLQRLQAAGQCDTRDATGTYKLRFHPRDRSIRTNAKINGVKGRFLIDTGASYVTLTQGFAARANLKKLNRAAFKIKTATGISEASSAIADEVTLGTLSAHKVEIAVMNDMLGDDIDGVLGLSFLSRFSMTVDYKKGIANFAPN